MEPQFSIPALAEWLATTGITVKIKNGSPILSRPHELHVERYEAIVARFKERLGNRRGEFLDHYARITASWEGHIPTGLPVTIGTIPGLGGVPHPLDIRDGCPLKVQRAILIERAVEFVAIYAAEGFPVRIGWCSLYTGRTGYLLPTGKMVPDDASHIMVDGPDDGPRVGWHHLPWHTPPRKWKAPMDWVPRPDWKRPKGWVPPKQSKREGAWKTPAAYYVVGGLPD